jgi:hypothetical protein
MEEYEGPNYEDSHHDDSDDLPPADLTARFEPEVKAMV